MLDEQMSTPNLIFLSVAQGWSTDGCGMVAGHEVLELFGISALWWFPAGLLCIGVEVVG